MALWKHILVVAAFALISLGQSLFGVGTHAEALGNAFRVFVAANAAVLVGLCYLNLYVFAPRLLMNGRYRKYLGTVLVVLAGYILLRWVAEEWLLARVGIERKFNAVTVLDWMSTLTMCAVCLMSTSAVILFRQLVEDTQKINEMENARLQSSVEKIKNRIDTRVLYRTLDYAARKVKTDPGKASEVIFRLSERLRRELYER